MFFVEKLNFVGTGPKNQNEIAENIELYQNTQNTKKISNYGEAGRDSDRGCRFIAKELYQLFPP